MFNRFKKLSGIGNAVFEGLSFGGIPPVSCPAAGLLLRDIDTSRNEQDFIGVSFFIPYTTHVYANGTCGETTTEEWGLQYLPAGWVTNVRTANISESWDFTTYDNTNATGSTVTKYETYYDTEDGTGINYAASQGFTYTINDTIVQTYYDGHTYRWNVWWSDSSKSFYLQDYTMYPTYGTYISETYDPIYIYISESDSTAVAGTSTNNNFADGYGGIYKVSIWVNWIENGTIIQTISSSNSQSYDGDNGQYYDNGYYTSTVAKSNGYGGYYTDSIIGGSYYENGTFVRVYSQSAYTSTWYGYTFDNGTYERIDRVWDGSGNFINSNPYTTGSYYPEYTFIGSGYYDNNSNGPYDLSWNGSGGFYETYQGGSNCDSSGTYYGVSCLYAEGYDAANNFYSGTWLAADTYADGSCGTYYNNIGYNTSGCYYPYGYYTSYSDNPSTVYWEAYDSYSSVQASGYATYASYGESNYSDGSGGNVYSSWSWNYIYGDFMTGGQFYDYQYNNYVYYSVYSDGSSGYYITYS